ncbi:saccharopine dehydrogenase NADP-binding domain-containing protein [Aliarcobacter butzleri]|uniref:saccharopine dehydrogenase C-terminal domain-containing protein n=1 Tax=Aliarcobacter butzleri TaxID=28197 RepID=UPI001EE00752|nr:saccharopine dehydrogenase C-terminal domain-containing protein [Aliarcobacter butzleri]MCG3674965.1 saccharopine dehydrogenase NADP-binding domain-containing protein [Aliarcobacter butzleri]MCT7620610.1 saccharopine dehydrogenase NADP-binding domain-containing protein [Aliarcobacter butzleri]
MKIVFFGVGAVCSVIARLLYDLSKKSSNDEIKFLFIVRDIKKAKSHFFKNTEVLNNSEFLEIKNFEEIFTNYNNYTKYLEKSTIFINTSIPDYNLSIMKLALAFKTNYADLASDIYNDNVISSLQFEQQSLNEEFEKNSLFALINLGISPGITNFLIGERIYSLSNLPYETKVSKIEINLLEEIQSKQLIFSWSPKVAIEEISYSPLFFKKNKLKKIEPFSKSKTYKFPYFKNFVEVYPVFQEEIISLKQSFKDVENIKMFVGGNEIELMKNLYQLNLLSNKYCYGYKDSEISINSIIKDVIPKMKSPQIIEDYIKNKTIKYAEFCAIADIYLEISYPQNSKKIKNVESIGISFNKYTNLIKTNYSGSTYISYPTGIGAGILIFYTLLNQIFNDIKGVLVTEKLPSILGPVTNDIIKRELSSYKINLINSIK